MVRMVDYTPDGRLNMVLTTIVPSIADNLEGDFQSRQLANHEDLAFQLNEICKNPIADLQQYFADVRERIKRNEKNVKRIQMASAPNQTF